MSKVKVKICGITRQEDYDLARRLGADYLGFIFVQGSPRCISPERARSLGQGERGGPRRVGVFQDEDMAEVLRIHAACRLDLVQLHGDESPDYCRALGIPYWKTIHVKESRSLEEIRRFPGATLLLDADHPRYRGGSGRSIPLDLVARALSSGLRLVVAGGIGAATVGKVMALHPHGVDICSSVESEPGIKSEEKMKRLFSEIDRWRQAGGNQ